MSLETYGMECVHKSDANIAILVVSCDAYKDVWRPFFHAFFKYWPDCPYPVFFGSNNLTYEDSRITPIMIGPDVDYSSNLLAMLEHIEQDWVITWMEDFILTAPVNTARVRQLVNLAQQMQVGHLKLANNPYSTEMVDDETRDIADIPRGSRYRVSFGLGLWRKSVLCKVLRPGETAWDIERQGTLRSYELEERFLRLSKPSLKDDPPFRHIYTGIWRGRWTRQAVAFLKQEGLHDCLGTRPWQTRRSYIKMRLTLEIRRLIFSYLHRYIDSSRTTVS